MLSGKISNTVRVCAVRAPLSVARILMGTSISQMWAERSQFIVDAILLRKRSTESSHRFVCEAIETEKP